MAPGLVFGTRAPTQVNVGDGDTPWTPERAAKDVAEQGSRIGRCEGTGWD